ncbi:putative ATP-dependent RNA helicase DDX52 [Clavelina lepadiformis]|uniref:putative ATP-dependent RNA helicase DDX52 n=1 Tax=Clavelina lepadiformis TaxID=159417 RepID=UPI00404265C1
MDEEDIFRKLGFGLKFNVKRFEEDARRVHLVSSKPSIPVSEPCHDLTFFQKPKNNSVRKKKIPSADDDVCGKIAKTDDQMKTSRKQHRIFVEGTDVPGIVSTFKQLQSTHSINETCIEAITEKMGFKTLTPIQMQAIPALLHGREVLACAPTGSGKTLAFLLPVINHVLNRLRIRKKGTNRGFLALVLSPTRELAKQTLQECNQLTRRFVGGKPAEELLNVKLLDRSQIERFTKVGKKHSKKMDILISTPNSIVYLLEHDPPLISLEGVERLVVDESDKLFEEGKEGKSFREQLGKVYASCNNPSVRRAMFSATFAHDVQQWCLLNMDNVLQITIGGKNTAVRSVEQEMRFVGNENGKLLALQQLIQQGFSPPILIFVQSKDRAKQLFAELIYDGKNIDAIHADRTAAQREEAVKRFRKGETWILICTELMGRGIDFKGVNLVINYDFPSSAVSYIHRVGRTGRAGRRGRAVTFFTDEDRPMLRSIANVIKEAGCEIPEYMLKLKKPSRKEQRALACHQVRRENIRSTPADILNKKRFQNQPKAAA